MELGQTEIIIVALIGAQLAAGLAWLASRRYEIAVVAVVLSPWLSAILSPAEDPMTGIVQEAGIGSYIRVGLLLLMGLAGLILFLRSENNRITRIAPEIWILGIFVLFALVSTVYSIDPRFTFVRSASFIAFIGFLLGMLTWLDQKGQPAKLLKTLFLIIAAGVVLNLASLVFLRDMAWWHLSTDRFCGLWDTPNSMGEFCMVSYPLCLWRYEQGSRRDKWLAVLVMVSLVALHALTGSRSTLAAGFMGIGLWFVLRNGLKRSLTVILVVFVLLASIVLLNPSFYQRTEGADITDLTGRTEFWSRAFDLFMERPILGYGFDVDGKIWSDPRFQIPGVTLWSGSAKTSLHNGYLSVAIGLGVIGLILWGMILLIPLWKGARGPKTECRHFAISILAVFLMVNFVETAITGGRSFGAIFFWIAWILAIRPESASSGASAEVNMNFLSSSRPHQS
jgi:O-antigen ligase